MSLEEDLKDFVNMVLNKWGVTELNLIYSDFLGTPTTFNNVTELKESIFKKVTNEEEFNKLVLIAKNILETHPSKISRSYFDIIEYKKVYWNEIIKKLSKESVNPEGEYWEGYEIKKLDENTYVGAYYYTKKKVFIDARGKFRSFPSQERIQFLLDTKEGILKIETSQVGNVKKVFSKFKDTTDLELDPLVVFAEIENVEEKISNFIKEFRKNPLLTSIDTVRIYHPIEAKEHDISKIKFEGFNIFENKEIKEKIKDGWKVIGLKMVIKHKGVSFKVKIGGTIQLSYVTIECGRNFNLAKELHNIIEEKFIYHFRS